MRILLELANKILFNRNRTLRSDLQLLRRKGAIKINGGSLDRPIIELKSSCARCRLVFGYINRGAECISCRFRVCRDCRVSLPHTNNDWVCIVCCKEMWVFSCFQGYKKKLESKTHSKRKHSANFHIHILTHLWLILKNEKKSIWCCICNLLFDVLYLVETESTQKTDCFP